MLLLHDSIRGLYNSYTSDNLQTENEKWKDDIQKGLDRYQEMVTKQEKIERLNKEMSYVK